MATCFEKLSGSKAKLIRNDLVKIFRTEFSLIITKENKMKFVNFLDVTFCLNTAEHEPYNKLSNIPFCINVKSNLQPNIIKTFQ